ncbi:Prephenate dehydrogenase [bacterium HR41]|nr:Prephenate dehydrogenase [bacterium HR41]
MRIAVLGVGLIGGSIALAARQRVPDATVVGWDPAPDALARARERGALDEAAPSLAEALAGAGACFLCAPVGQLADLAAAALAAAPRDCVVSDVGSAKAPLARASRDERFIGGHPLAGAETAGVEHARGDLFDGAVWYLTPTPHSSGILYERLHRLIVTFGARPVAIDADRHDRLVAAVSHLPHVLANVLAVNAACAAEREREPVPPLAPSLRDATRVAGANSDIWTDIYLANRDAIADEVERVRAALGEVVAALRRGDPGWVRDWTERARAARRTLVERDLADGPLHELAFVVPNRPGVVAQVALGLSRAGVNIADLALAPAADMRSGAITVWVAGDEQADRAREVIEGLGFAVAER